MEPQRMKGKKLRDKSSPNCPEIPSASLSLSISDTATIVSDTMTTVSTLTTSSLEKEIPKLNFCTDDFDSPPISPARIARSKIWLDANVKDLDSSLFYTNLGNNLYKVHGTITCTKPSIEEKEKEMRIYFDTIHGKQIKEITGDNKVQLAISTAFSTVGLLVGGIFFDTHYYFSPLKARKQGDVRVMFLDEFEDFVSGVDRSIITASWCIRITGLVNML